MIKNNRRDSNLELLRIISMFMIVFIHANMYLWQFCSGGCLTFFNGLVNGICNIGVTCFILISGYFGMQFKLRKLVKMECMMITYSLLETVILFLAFPEQMQGAGLLEQAVKSCLPFITRKYWFYSCYVCIYLFSGWINRFAEQLEKQDYKKLLVLLLIVFCVFPTLFYFEITQDGGKGLVQMLMIYLIGRYIRLHRDVTPPRGRLIALILLLWLINGISHEIPLQFGNIYHHLCKDNSITNICRAISVFYFFKGFRLRAGWINGMAAGLFAVFALNNTLTTAVMEKYVPLIGYPDNSLAGFLFLAGMVILILFLCILVGLGRELLLGRVDCKWVNF